jgi:hypothetical protein
MGEDHGSEKRSVADIGETGTLYRGCEQLDVGENVTVHV